jgi:hypothetical protein
MIKCKCCDALIKEDTFCPLCGYDPKTDTISASFRQSAASSQKGKRRIEAQERSSIGPGVKMFAFVGLAVVIFSILYKHNFNLNGAMLEVKQAWDNGVIKASKIIPKEFGIKEGSKTFNPTKPFVVQAVFWGVAEPQAVINNRIFNIGDVIEGAKVVQINKKGVTFLYKGQKYLFPSSISKYNND